MKSLIFLLVLALLAGTGSAYECWTVHNIPTELGSEEDGQYADGYFTLLRVWEVTGNLYVSPTTSKINSEQWSDMVNVSGSFEQLCADLQVDEFQDMR